MGGVAVVFALHLSAQQPNHNSEASAAQERVLRLVPTNHARLPRDRLLLWLAPP